MLKKKHIETHTFKKGQKVHLDSIYNIQGLGNDNWWEREDPENDLCENLVITRDITIRIEIS